jgi:hypothetical protein
MEMNYHNELILSARLEESMLNIGERNINCMAFLGEEANTILVNFQVSQSFLANNVWSNDKVLKDFFFSFNSDEIFKLSSVILSFLTATTSLLI